MSREEEGSPGRKELVVLTGDQLNELTADSVTAGFGHASCWHEWLQSVEQILLIDFEHLDLHLYQTSLK